MRIGMAPLPWAAMSAPTRKTIWLEPPMARAEVPSHPIVRGCSGVCARSCGIERPSIACFSVTRGGT
jgi:hypothetical protein